MGMFCMGIFQEFVDVFVNFMFVQIVKLVVFNQMLCCFCFDDYVLLLLFVDKGCSDVVVYVYLVILMVGQQVEGVC